MEAVAFRQAVFRDFAEADVLAAVAEFARRMRDSRKRLAQLGRLDYPHEKQAWFLDAVRAYLDAVDGLSRALGRSRLRSRGLRGFRRLPHRARRLRRLQGSRDRRRGGGRGPGGRETYCLNIKDGRVRVSRYEGEEDYSAEIEATFAKFKRGAAADRRATFPAKPR